MIIDLSVRVKKKIREKNVIAVTRSRRFQHDQRSRQHGVEFAVQVY